MATNNDIPIGDSIVIRKFTLSTLDSNVSTQLSRPRESVKTKKPLVPTHDVSKNFNGDKTDSKELTRKNDRINSKRNNITKRKQTNLSLIIATTETTSQSDLQEINNENSLLNQSKYFNETNTIYLETTESDDDTIDNRTITTKLKTIPVKSYKALKVEDPKEEKEEKENENQETLDLLHKIKDIPVAVNIGPIRASLQACRFELPHNLRILETLTPLDYLSQYCRLSPRRKHQFQRIFNRFLNKYYLFESSYLYSSLIYIHKENITRTQFNYLCQLIDFGNQEYQFKFDTYSGILALCERIVYYSSDINDNYDNLDLTKNALEKCDFYGLDRKLDGLNISEAMKRLLRLL